MNIEEVVDKFIDMLIINSDNSNRGLKLYTSIQRHAFYVYKNNNGKIIIKPLEGESYFYQPKNRILKVLYDELAMTDNDLSYVKPIVEYVKEYYLIK